MILDKFKTGWQEAFERKIQALVNTVPNIKFLSAERYHGMLRIKFEALDKSEDTQYILDCVTHKIERESAKTCEKCGEYGTRRDSYLPEKMTLCWMCYALEVDALSNTNTITFTETR